MGPNVCCEHESRIPNLTTAAAVCVCGGAFFNPVHYSCTAVQYHAPRRIASATPVIAAAVWCYVTNKCIKCRIICQVQVTKPVLVSDFIKIVGNMISRIIKKMILMMVCRKLPCFFPRCLMSCCCAVVIDWRWCWCWCCCCCAACCWRWCCCWVGEQSRIMRCKKRNR